MGLIDGGERWAFFGFSMLAFIPIMWFLCKLENDDGVCCGAAANLSPQGKLFQRVLLITIITWSMYPIVWILATSGGATVSSAAAAYGAPPLLVVPTVPFRLEAPSPLLVSSPL